jgi:adenylate cyclase
MSLRLPPHHLLLTMICLGFTAAVIALYHTNGQYERLEQAGRDWLMTNGRARRAERDPRIVFLAIDEATRELDTVFSDDIEKSPALKLMKQGFPWNRAVYAHIIDRLADAGAKAIVFDLVFPTERDGDDQFHAALERHRDLVVIGCNLVQKDQEDVGESITTATLQDVLPAPSILPPDRRDPRLGFVNVHEDPDGILRRIHYRTTLPEFFGRPASAANEELLSLAAAALKQAGFADRIPPGHQPSILRFAEDFKPRSLHEIFVEANWNAPPYNQGALFRDKIVFIGATGQSSEDRLQTPFGITPGPSVHLNAMNAALKGEFMTGNRESVNLWMIVAGGVLAWLLGAYVRRTLIRLPLLALAAAVFVQSAQWMANDSGLLINLFGPLFALVASGLTWSAWEQILDRVERLRLRRFLERYVSKDIVHELLDNRQTTLDSLGGERRKVTVLFSDVRGFTTLTENADPHALVTQLNEYFEDMVAIVFANRGTLDKFIGDAVMAHWGGIGIPTEDPAVDVERALTTVLQMRTALAKLNADWQERGMPEMHVGFGVNYGDAIVGNLGCEAKMEVTVIGDAVNLGSRLEGATKQYKIDVCIGENAAALVRDQFILRSVDLIIVQGKTHPVEIFTVLDVAGSPVPPWLSHHDEAMRLYRAGDFRGAEKAWCDVLSQAPHDGIAETFIARCRELQKQPLVAPWTGAYEMKSK